MSEPGADPKNPKKNLREQYPFKLEKMGKDDLLAILGGVVSSPSESEPEQVPVETPVVPVVPKPMESQTEAPAEPAIQVPVMAHVEAPVEPAIQESVESHVEAPVEPVIQEPVVDHVETPVELAVQKPVESHVEALAKPVVQEHAEASVETPAPSAIKPPAKPSAEFITRASAPSMPLLSSKPDVELSLTEKPDAVSEILDEMSEEVRPFISKPPVQTEAPKGLEIGAVPSPILPVEPPPTPEISKEALAPVKESLPVPPPVEAALPQMEKAKPLEIEPPEPGKAHFQLPPSLTPPSMESMFPKNVTLGTDPLGLFKSSAPSSTAIPPAGPESAKPQGETAASGMSGPFGLKPSTPQNDPLHLFDGPPVASPDKTFASPKPTVDLSHLSPSKDVTSDPLHLLNNPMAPAAATPVTPVTPAGVSPTAQGMVPDTTAPLPESEAWKSTLTRPSALSRAYTPHAEAADAKKASFLRRKLQPLADISKIPVKIWEILTVLVFVGLLAGVVMFFHKPTYQLVDRLEALSPARTDVRQIVELDITAFIDIESKIKQLGFAPLIQLSVPEIPAPNLFAVYTDSGNQKYKSYAVILKVPGSNMPRLSFVNVLSNGTWLSTNGWASKDQELDKLSSESTPGQDPVALWAHHQKRVDQAIQTGVTVSSVNERRFICALCDHLRWYMELKDIPAYKALFENWF
jgi:hypothetical protein